ncbi:hypothetical protein V2J09_010012 [Rumex salicifolius]
MFTEGLDQNAINWIKQGTNAREEDRPPLAEFSSQDQIPKSPSFLRGCSNYTAMPSPHALPPLKFHSGLLGTHSVSTYALFNENGDDEEDEYADGTESEYEGTESVASVPDETYDNYSETSVEETSRYDANHAKVHVRSDGSLLNRGSSTMNLKVEIPQNVRRLNHLGLGASTEKFLTPTGDEITPQNVQITPIHKTKYYDAVDLGTPSAPPVNCTGKDEDGDPEVEDELERACDDTIDERSGDGVYVPAGAHYYNGNTHVSVESFTNSCENNEPNENGQNAWQILVAYDACIRLCLYSWSRGCPDAPEFLRDECQILRSAFGLHKFLLQPRGAKPIESSSNEGAEQVCSIKAKKVLGKIRVEVKKLRIVPRRKLKNTFSQRSALYVQAGAEYVRLVSSYVKNGINTLMSPTASMCEEPMSCLLMLKSSTEDPESESGSAICLRPGTGDYHDFFPESQHDALVIEFQDVKRILHGQAIVPVSSLADSSNDKSRWWPIYHDEHECIGKIQLVVSSTVTSEEDNNVKQSGPVVETLAYDLLLEAAMRAEQFHSRNLRLRGPWKWLLSEFADYYGVSDSYTKLRYLSYVMDVGTPTKACLELVQVLLVPVTKARSERKLNRQEKSMLLECETQVQRLLQDVFENYKSLDELSAGGISNSLTPIPERAPPALAPAVQVYCLLHDILAQDAQKILQNYLQTAAKKRCKKHMLETDELLSCNSENILVDPVATSTAYLKMKNLCLNLASEIHADIKIHNQHILPSSIDLSNIAAHVYSTELCKRIRSFLAACPPSSPLPHVNALLIATADFERNLELWNISPIQGGVSSKDLFDDYIRLWVQEMEFSLLELCKAEKVPWFGVLTSHSTSPFAENMYSKIKDALTQYEVVISRWPQYSLVLENAVAEIERGIIKALEKQYNDILTPLKDSIPKKLGMQVQKLARRQSTSIYTVPNQLGTFLNTLKRILDFLHCKIEEILKPWASCLPITADQKSSFGEQMNGITVLLRTKYKNYMQAIVTKLYSNMQASRCTQLKRILEETQDSDGEAEINERMQLLTTLFTESISNLHDVFVSQIFVAICRAFWDRMGQCVLKFLEGRKENRVWYKGSYYALGILDDTFASQMQRLQGNALQEKDLEPPRAVVEARSILCRDASNGRDQSTYFYF